jgi:hypothetical protein
MATPVEFTDPAVRRALRFERAGAALVVAGSLVVVLAAAVLIARIRGASDRDLRLFELRPTESPLYGWWWLAMAATAIVTAGRGFAIGSGAVLATSGYAILATALDVITLALGLKIVLAGASVSVFTAVLYTSALSGIVASSRIQEAAARARRPQLRFWTKGTTGAFCATLALPVAMFVLTVTLLPRGAGRDFGLVSGVMQGVFLVGLILQICLHATYGRFVHTALSDPVSLE